jgi:hypothetical protein
VLGVEGVPAAFDGCSGGLGATRERPLPRFPFRTMGGTGVGLFLEETVPRDQALERRGSGTRGDFAPPEGKGRRDFGLKPSPECPAAGAGKCEG